MRNSEFLEESELPQEQYLLIVLTSGHDSLSAGEAGGQLAGRPGAVGPVWGGTSSLYGTIGAAWRGAGTPLSQRTARIRTLPAGLLESLAVLDATFYNMNYRLIT